MRIAFLTNLSPFNYKNWSGILTKQYEMLAKEYTVEWLGHYPMPYYIQLRYFIIKFFWTRILKKGMPSHQQFISKRKGAFFSKKLKENNYDLLFVPAATDCLAYLETNIPVVYFNDATIRNLIDYYPTYYKLPTYYARQLNEMERLAINKSTILMYTSSWASAAAIRYYQAGPDKIVHMHFPPSYKLVDGGIKKSEVNGERICNLLFVGSNWERKGGNIVAETFQYLKGKGINVRLTVVGCKIPEKYDYLFKDDQFTYFERLSKSNGDEFHIFCKLFSSADFFILPTRADCTPVVFSEAGAFGVPVLTSDTGGVRSVIKEGINGYVLHYSAQGKDFGDKILNLWNDSEKIMNLKYTTKNCFEENLSESIWILKFKQVLKRIPSNCR